MVAQFSSLPYQFPQIDQQQALRQLSYFNYLEGENVYLRFFYHSTDPRKNSDKGRKLDQMCWNDVERYQRDGRGVYVVVNGAGGGHEDKDIKQCAAIYCEWDDRPVENQLLHWETVGFFEPTFTIYSGDKSAQPYWVFDYPLDDVEQWRELQLLLIEVMGADPANKNPSRVFRLAGGWHVKPGRAPVMSEIVQESGKKYSPQQLLEKLRSMRQHQVEQPTMIQNAPTPQQQSNQRFTRYKDITVPVPESVPLESCLSKGSQARLQSGEAMGGRNTNGASLARDLIGTANYLQSIGQRFDGNPRQLLDEYAQSCTPPLPAKEVDGIWRSAEKDRPGPSCKPEGVDACIRGWYWNNYIKSSQPTHTHEVMPHPAMEPTGGNSNPPQPSANAYSLVKALVCSGLAPAELLGQLIELSEATGYQLKGLQDLARQIEAELSSHEAQSTDALETNKLVEYRQETLDLRRVFPEPLANYLLTKADSDRIDPVYIYQFLWSAIGLSLGAHIGILGKEGTTDADSWVEFPIYYNMTVAPPSSGKSQTMRSVLGPIKRQQDRAQAEYKKAQKHLEKLKLEWNKFSAEDFERLKESELNPSVYEKQMPQPPLEQLIEAGTPEGAFKRMSELPALSGCALAFDELIRILSLDQYKNQGGDTRQILMEAWSQPCSIKFVRSDDNNAPSLNKICINITGGIQPAKAKKLASDPDDGDGLLSRFLIAQTKTPDNFAVWSSTKVEIDQALSGLYEFLGSLHFSLGKTIYGDDYLTSAVDGEQIILPFDAPAEERWQQWWSHLRTEMQRVEHENPALFGYLGKMLSQTLRLALGLHCMELMYSDKPEPLKVGLATLERAIYAAKFHIGQFRLLQANNDTNNLPGQLAKIHQYAQRKGTEVSATQVQNTVFKRLERKPTLAVIREYFKQLAEAGVAKLIGVGKDLKILVQKIVGSSVGIPTSSDQKSDAAQVAGSIAVQFPQGLEPKKSDFSDKRESASPTAVGEVPGFLQSSNSVSGCGADCSLSQDCPNCRNSSVESTPNQGRELDSGSKHLSDFSSEDVGKSDSGEKSDSPNDPPGGASGGGGQPTTPPAGDDSGVGEHLTESELADWHRRMETCQSRNDAEALWDSLEALPEGQREIVESSLCWDGFFSWWQEPEPDTTTAPSRPSAQAPESAKELPSPQPQLEELKALLLACSTLVQLDNLKRSHKGIGKAYRALSESEQNRIDAIAALAVPYKVYKYCGEATGQLRSGALVYIDPSATLRALGRFAPVWVLNGVARGWKAPVEVSLSLLRSVVKAVSIELPETDLGQQMGLI